MISSREVFRIFALGFATIALQAEDWPQWRGPDRNGISREKGWLEVWPAEGPKIAWKAKTGLGFSSIVVANGKAYTLGHEDEKDTVYCFDAKTGKEVWTHEYPADLGDKFFEGGTTGSPTVDGDKVYVLSRWGDLFCFQAADGKIIWQRNLQNDSDNRIPTWGFTGAPTVVGDLVYLNVGEAGMALNKKDGTTVWSSENKDPGYSTPLPVQLNGKDILLVSSGAGYSAVDPKTGAEQWQFPWQTQYGVNAADPIVSGEKIFISTGYGKGAALLDVSGNKKPEVVWQSKVLRTQLSPGVLWEGHVYGRDGDTTETARLKCVELATGKEKWVEPGIGSGGVLIADGKLIVLSSKGELMVAPATPEGIKPISRAQVMGGKIWTVPTLANGIVYCRNSKGDIVAVDLRKDQSVSLN